MPGSLASSSLDHEPSFRAVRAAAPALALLAHAVHDDDLMRAYAITCGELVHGFREPAGSPGRRAAHHRAWIGVRELERGVIAARIGRRAPARLVAKAQRAIDRADVWIGDLAGIA
jgi:predicted nucleic acid-binding protein